MDSLDSFEEIERGQIQTIPASLVEKRDNYERLRRQMELQQAEEEQERQLQDQQQVQQEEEKQEVVPQVVDRMKAQPPSALTTPSSGHSESAGRLQPWNDLQSLVLMDLLSSELVADGDTENCQKGVYHSPVDTDKF